MSVDMEARFGLTRLKKSDMLRRLSRTLPSSGYLFDGYCLPLVASKTGAPELDILGTDTDLLNTEGGNSDFEVLEAASAKWWGVGFMCVSTAIRDHMGRTTLMEVGFSLFPVGRQMSLSYRENSRATDYRVEDDACMADLHRLLHEICVNLEFSLCVFREGGLGLQGVAPIPDVAEVDALLSEVERGDFPEFLALVHKDQLDFETVRKRAGKYEGRVKLTTRGFVSMNFLAPP